MTAIALLNPECDPHIVADTMLTAKGNDPNPNSNLWLPALGSVQSEWESNQEPWHIVQLGRKTLLLPNRSGILAFSGDCATAFNFWSELSSKFVNTTAFDPNRKVDQQMVRDALRYIDADEISLLGMLIDENGALNPFIHNCAPAIHTRNMGTCYVAGSGAAIVRRIIENHDQQIGEMPQQEIRRRMGPTEDLAERIAAQLLFVESDKNNGQPGTSIASRCGGFYEWYQVQPKGVLPLRSRLDLHFEHVEGKLRITRAYLCEQVQLKAPLVGAVTSQKYSVRVLNLGLETMEPKESCSDWWEFTPEECYGVSIESTFELYDKLESACRKEGPVTTDLLAEMFGVPVDIIRIRLVCFQQGEAILRSASRLVEEEEILARVMLKDGRACVQFRGEIAAIANDCLARLRKPS